MNEMDTVDNATALTMSEGMWEEMLIKVAPAAVIGDLAATVAHEINNPVFGILNFLELAKEELPEDHPVQEYLNEGLNQAERISRLVSDLMCVARSNTGVPEVIQPNDTVKAAVALYLKRLIKQHIEVQQNYADTVPMIFGVRGGLMAAVVDLLDNARRSMESQGNGSLLLESAVTGSGWFQLKIEDYGTGLPDQNLSEVFQPFVSLWDSPSVGLGLCRAKNWVDSMHGRILFEKCPSHQGMSVLIQLPPSIRENQSII